ncbi:MAG: putative glyoxylase CFP32 [Ignavibacteria bacterium]|nr:putative glyoxylase CFP32 [Ignavibacteria bacterium]
MTPRAQLIPVLILLSAVIYLTGCSVKPVEFPSVNYSANKTHTPGQIVWRDLISPDPAKSIEFYSNVFGWTAVKSGSDEDPYWLFKLNGKPIAGMVQMKEERKRSGGEWVQYYSLNTQEDFYTRAKSLGASQIFKPLQIPGRGKVSLYTDPDGAYFALINSSNGDPEFTEPSDFQFLWSELWSNNTDKSSEFYKNAFNFQLEEKKDDTRNYIVLKNNDKLVSGIIKNPAENVRNHWLQYIRVSDVKSIEQKAISAGAKVIIPSDPKIRKGTVSVFIDPTGAPVGIQKWPIE